MTNGVALDNVAHQNLRVIPRHAPEFGDAVNQTLIFPTEFANAQREYPILFRKDAEGALQSVALLGFDKDENLFLDAGGWNARYIPAVHRRGPFLIGFRNQDEHGRTVREPMVFVDLENPRISAHEGEPVFLPHGGNAPYLEHVSRALEMIYSGVEASQPMFAAFAAEGLIEEMSVEVKLDETTAYTLPDFFTISQDRLSALDGAALERLNKPGFLHLAMLVVTSLGNINHLIELKNRKRAAG